jgi:hypothetical protein
MVAASLGSFILAGVLAAFLFIGRTGSNLRNYSDMEAQARKALEVFAQDTRQASNVEWASANSVAMTVNGVSFTYTFNPSTGKFTRAPTLNAAAETTLLTGITNFQFLAFSITGVGLTDFSSAAALTNANNKTKQIQISLSAARSTQTVATATNIVLSARYVLRNKKVTA